MPLFELEGKRPSVHPDAFIAPTATLVAAGSVVTPGTRVDQNPPYHRQPARRHAAGATGVPS